MERHPWRGVCEASAAGKDDSSVVTWGDVLSPARDDGSVVTCLK